MSTTFAVKTPQNPEGIVVAFRSNGGGGQANIEWKNPLAPLLPRNTPVVPLDNSPQGIYTIGDLLEKIDGIYEIDEQ